MINRSASIGAALTRPLSRLASRLPRPASAVFAAGLNIVLKRDLPMDVYLQLTGRCVEIFVADWNMRFRFAVKPEGFKPLGQGNKVDLSISATARDFALLAAGEEDADTLYFDRRVVVEGDTELALLIKNTLDALPARKTRHIIRVVNLCMDRLTALRDRHGVDGRTIMNSPKRQAGN